MQNKFTQKAQNTLKSALAEAGRLGHPYIGSEHLLLALICEKDSIAARILISRGLSATSVRCAIEGLVGTGESCHPSPSDLTPHARGIIESSSEIATERGCTYIGTEHLLSALLAESGCTALKIISDAGINPSLVSCDLAAHSGTLSPTAKKVTEKDSEPKENTRTTGALALYSRDLTALAAQGGTDPVIGREKETERVIEILSRRKKNNPCLVGEPGVGKTAIVEGLAKRIADRAVPASLLGTRILSLDIPSMLAGAKYRGEFEERMKNVIAQTEKHPEIILFIDEMHVIVGAGAAEGAVDAANILKPALARGGIRVIGATTYTEYKKHIERDSALERRFQSVTVEEPSEEMALTLLEGLKAGYEAHHHVKIGSDALQAAVSLSARYIHDRFLPDKAVDLMDEAAARVSITQGAGQKIIPAPQVTPADIAQVISLWTGIPTSKILGGKSQALAHLEEKLSKRIIGQDKAIASVCSAIRRGSVGLGSTERPTGVFIFLGKTGVGKTALARAVAEELFGSKSALVRFDMSEYTEKHSVSKLIGSPPGYVGYGEGGLLTEKVRRRPYCVLLFDEIEKAHPDVFNLLLPLLEDGKLCDSQGREVNFRNTVVIMTSNAGAGECDKITGFSDRDDAREMAKENMLTELRRVFPPEFLSRVDEITVFDELDAAALGRIADSELCELAARSRKLGYTIKFGADVTDFICSQAKKKSNGARDIRRLISQYVEAPVAQALLSGTVSQSQDITLFAQNDGVRVSTNQLPDETTA